MVAGGQCCGVDFDGGTACRHSVRGGCIWNNPSTVLVLRALQGLGADRNDGCVNHDAAGLSLVGGTRVVAGIIALATAI